jgi:hypothetical protein
MEIAGRLDAGQDTHASSLNLLSNVIPAEAGIQSGETPCLWPWIPAFAGMTEKGLSFWRAAAAAP